MTHGMSGGPIVYTNRKGMRYFLCLGKTKKGKTRYSFSREPGATPASTVPAGHEIRESVNGVKLIALSIPKLGTDAYLELF